MPTLSKLYRGDTGDQYKSVGLRLEAYDVELLTRLLTCCDSKQWDTLIELVRAQRPLWKARPADDKRWKDRLERFTGMIDKDSVLWKSVVEHEQAKYDPFSFLETAHQKGTLEEHCRCALNLSIRDRLDIDHDTSEVFAWLTERVNGVDREGTYKNPGFFGTQHFRVGEEVVWANNEFGTQHPNFFPAEDLAAPLKKLDELWGVRLFDLEEAWRDAVTTFYSTGRRIFFAPEEEQEALRREILASADWAFATAMHQQRMLYRKLNEFYQRAQRKGWGVFAFDALDP